MSNVKTAVDAAIRAINGFYPDKEFDELELEEIIPSEDGSYWLITLGYNVLNTYPPVGLAATLAPQKKYERKYKVIKVDASTYEVLSMKIREI